MNEPQIIKPKGIPSSLAFGVSQLWFIKKFTKYDRKCMALTWLATIAINMFVTFIVDDKWLAFISATILAIIPFWIGSKALVRYVIKEIGH